MQLKGQTLTHDPVINHPIIDQLTIQKESKKNYLLAQKWALWCPQFCIFPPTHEPLGTVMDMCIFQPNHEPESKKKENIK